MPNPPSTTPSGDPGDRPLWRKHFPIDQHVETAQSRRQFVGGLAVAGGAMACGNAALNSLSPASVSETETHDPPLVLEKKFADLQDGEAFVFHYPDHRSPCILVRLKDEFVAFSQKCTHLACPVLPDPAAGRFECPCHKGAFDLQTGAPLSGPPRTALPRIAIERNDDGTLTATGVISAAS